MTEKSTMVTVVLGRPSLFFKLKLWLGGHPRFHFKNLLKNHTVELGKLNWEKSFISHSRRWALVYFTDSKGGVWQQGFSIKELMRLRPSEGTWVELRPITQWEAPKLFFSQLFDYFPRSLSIQYTIVLLITAYCLHPMMNSDTIPNWVDAKTNLYPNLHIQSSTVVNLVKALMLGIVMHLLLITVPVISYLAQTFFIRSKFTSNRIALKFEFAMFALLFLSLLKSSVGEWRDLHALEKHFFAQLSECLVISNADACEKVDTGIAVRARFPASKRSKD